MRILVDELAVNEVGEGLESAVRVPRRALRLPRRVFDLAHLVHVDERIEVGGTDAGEGAPNRKALALVSLRAASDRGDAPRLGTDGQ